MSFIITMYVREGIVMASDSRFTLNTEEHQPDKTTVQIALNQSDTSYKTFLAPDNIGISTFGDADIKGVPISGYIESFIGEQMQNFENIVDEIPNKLLEYFKKLQPVPDTQFHVAGYKEIIGGRKEPQVWRVWIAEEKVERINKPDQQGASWGGEADIFTRLMQPVAVINQDGTLNQSLPQYQIPFRFFTLQDAIDFCIFAIRSTIDAIRFQPRPKTVGGPIDVLVIKPDKAFWVQRKELHV